MYEIMLYFWEKKIGAGRLSAVLFLKLTKPKILNIQI